MTAWRIGVMVVTLVLGFTQSGCTQGGETSQPEGRGTQAAATVDPAESQAKSRPRQMQTPWWLDPSITAKVALTPDQLEQVKQLMAGRTDSDVDQNKRERRTSLMLLRALSKEPYDKALVDRLSSELDDVLGYNHRRRIAQVRGLRDVLTQEQWVTLWKVAPHAVQIGRFHTIIGGTIHVSDGTPEPAVGEPTAGNQGGDEGSPSP